MHNKTATDQLLSCRVICFMTFFYSYHTSVHLQDRRFPREEWPAIKATLPLGVVPALEVDGKMIGQSGAIGGVQRNPNRRNS